MIKKLRKYLIALPAAAEFYHGYFNLLRVILWRGWLHGKEGVKKLILPFLDSTKSEKQNHTHASSFEGKIAYVIWAPDYGENSAGVRCLYLLCDALNKRGLRSVVVGSKLGPDHLHAPIVSRAIASAAVVAGAAAIYPETISGNPLNAKTVVRWVMNKPGWIGGDKIYSPSEHIFYYAEGYRRAIQNKIAGKLFLPTLDESLFYHDGTSAQQRNLECFYVGKSVYKAGNFDKDKTFEITRQSPSRSELGKLLRASRVLYCFDNSTALTYEAVMCGCAVVIIPDGTQKREDYEFGELGIDGIAWGLQEYRNLAPNPEKMINRYQQLKNEFEIQLDHFIRVTKPQDRQL